MDGKGYRSQWEFDAELAVGDRVEARWTNSHRCFNAPATVVKLNEKSLRVRLDASVGPPRADGTTTYPAGWVVVLPRLTFATRWSTRNGVFPPHPVSVTPAVEAAAGDPSPSGEGGAGGTMVASDGQERRTGGRDGGE